MGKAKNTTSTGKSRTVKSAKRPNPKRSLANTDESSQPVKRPFNAGSNEAGESSAKMERPKFNAKKTEAARLEATLATGTDYSTANLKDADLAAPHRAPYSKLRDSVLKEEPATVSKRLETLLDASDLYEKAFRDKATTLNPGKEKNQYNRLADLYHDTAQDLRGSLKTYNSDSKSMEKKTSLIKSANNLASNAPGLGPQSTTNGPVSNRLHLQTYSQSLKPRTSGFLTPRSNAAYNAYSDIAFVATVKNGTSLVTPSGRHTSMRDPDIRSLRVAGRFTPEQVNVDPSRTLSGSLAVSPKGTLMKG